MTYSNLSRTIQGLAYASTTIALVQFLAPTSVQAATLSQYNLIVFEDLDISSNVFGNTIVGGNLRGNGDFAVRRAALDQGPDTLIVGGHMNGNFNVNAGNVRYGGNQRGNLNLNGNYGSGRDKIFDSSIDISHLVTELTADSMLFSSLEANSTVQAPSPGGQHGPVIFNASGDDLAVFNINGNDIFGNNRVQQIEFNLNGSETAIINVRGTDINFRHGNIVGNLLSEGVKDKVIWNFFEATDIRIERQLYGSLLAPHAHVQNRAFIEGTVAVRSLNQDAQIHTPSFSGQIPDLSPDTPEPQPVSEPSSILGTIALVLGMFKFKR